MALKFRHLSAPQAKQALRYKVVNSTDEYKQTPVQLSTRDAVGQCAHDTRRGRLQPDTIPRNRRHWRHRRRTGLCPRCFSRLKRHSFREIAFECGEKNKIDLL